MITLKNLTFAYSGAGRNALENINISVEDGDFVLICGPSGCGKTTLLRLLSDKIRPSGSLSGELICPGKSGFMEQNFNHLTVTGRRMITQKLEAMGVSQDEIRRRIAETAAFFGIEKISDKNISTLSGGQRQILTLASVLATEPDVLLLDEPFSRLDPVSSEELFFALIKVCKELCTTVIVAEHGLEDLFPVADKILVLDRGRQLLYMPPRGAAEKLIFNDALLPSLPAAIKIYAGLETKASCPLTVKEGRKFLKDNFSNELNSLKEEIIAPQTLPSVTLKNLWFRYKKNSPDVLRGLSMQAYPGENFAVLGDNGSGKSTLLSVIAGINRHYRGKVRLGKNSVVGLLPQNPRTFFSDSVISDELKELACEEDIFALAEKLGISDILNKTPDSISGGQLQRAAFCKLLLKNPQIVLLDEPTKGIDTCLKKSLAEIIDILKKENKTVIMVTHDIEFAAEYADRCGFLFSGDIISQGNSKEFFAKNSFYTTAAARISKGFYENAVLCDDVIKLCRLNKKGLSH